MARLYLPFFLLLSILHLVPEAVNSATVGKNSGDGTDFIKTSCDATLYPDLCFHSLSIYRNTIQNSPKQLAQAALLVSLARVRSATNFISTMTKVKGIKGREYQAVKDCVENMHESVDRLSQSIKELGEMDRVTDQSFMWHMGNVQTWVSAALTDEDTCVDGFSDYGSDGHVKDAIKSRVVEVEQVTSNALALINQLAPNHP